METDEEELDESLLEGTAGGIMAGLLKKKNKDEYLKKKEREKNIKRFLPTPYLT